MKFNLKHKKGSVIKIKRGYYSCICVDNEIAVFAKSNGKGTKVKYNDLFAVNSKYGKDNVISGHDYCSDEAEFYFERVKQ